MDNTNERIAFHGDHLVNEVFRNQFSIVLFFQNRTMVISEDGKCRSQSFDQDWHPNCINSTTETLVGMLHTQQGRLK